MFLITITSRESTHIVCIEKCVTKEEVVDLPAILSVFSQWTWSSTDLKLTNVFFFSIIVFIQVVHIHVRFLLQKISVFNFFFYFVPCKPKIKLVLDHRQRFFSNTM